MEWVVQKARWKGEKLKPFFGFRFWTWNYKQRISEAKPKIDVRIQTPFWLQKLVQAVQFFFCFYIPVTGSHVCVDSMSSEHAMKTAQLQLVLLGTILQWPTGTSIAVVGRGWLFWALLAGKEVLKGVRLFHPVFFSRLAQPGDETFLFCGGFCAFVFFVFLVFAVLFWFCFGVHLSHSQLLHTKAVESFKSQWKGTRLLQDLCLGPPSLFTSL